MRKNILVFLKNKKIYFAKRLKLIYCGLSTTELNTTVKRFRCSTRILAARHMRAKIKLEQNMLK
jgi:hypothetical protein